MATSITVIARLASGGYAYFQNADVSTGTAGEEILSSNATALLNQTPNVSAGQFLNNQTITHAVAVVSTQNAYTGSYLWCAIKDAQGKIVCPVQGGGGVTGELPALYKPVRMTTGMVIEGAWQAAADSATLYASLTVCTPTKCDIFFGQGSDSAAVELLNASGSTIGQSLQGSTSKAMWGVYPSPIGMNNQGAGVSALWITDSQGQLKGLVPPSDGGGGEAGLESSIPPVVMTPVMFTQNDSAYVATDT